MHKYVEGRLHEKWQYAGEELDYMTFYSDGRIEMSNDKRIYARCVYASIVADEVNIECKIRNKTRELVYVVNNNNKTLTSTNKDGELSVYNKI